MCIKFLSGLVAANWLNTCDAILNSSLVGFTLKLWVLYDPCTGRTLNMYALLMIRVVLVTVRMTIKEHPWRTLHVTAAEGFKPPDHTKLCTLHQSRIFRQIGHCSCSRTAGFPQPAKWCNGFNGSGSGCWTTWCIESAQGFINDVYRWYTYALTVYH